MQRVPLHCLSVCIVDIGAPSVTITLHVHSRHGQHAGLAVSGILCAKRQRQSVTTDLLSSQGMQACGDDDDLCDVIGPGPEARFQRLSAPTVAVYGWPLSRAA